MTTLMSLEQLAIKWYDLPASGAHCTSLMNWVCLIAWLLIGLQRSSSLSVFGLNVTMFSNYSSASGLSLELVMMHPTIRPIGSSNAGFQLRQLHSPNGIRLISLNSLKLVRFVGSYHLYTIIVPFATATASMRPLCFGANLRSYGLSFSKKFVFLCQVLFIPAPVFKVSVSFQIKTCLSYPQEASIPFSPNSGSAQANLQTAPVWPSLPASTCFCSHCSAFVLCQILIF